MDETKNLVALAVTLILLISSVTIYYQLPNRPKTQVSLQYKVEEAFPKLSFNYPVGLYCPQDGTNRLFVVSQLGFIYVFKNNGSTTSSANIFLDIHDRIHSGALLGMAFHPLFAINGYFYVYYLADNPLRTIIAQWSVLPDKLDEADPNSQKILMEIPQVSEAHSGGQLAFGPDGYLYIAIGDGSPYGDIYGNAQNRSALQGKILRINVDTTSGNMSYGIPRDNPFVGNSEGFREEIFAWGLRNPWRFSFDPVTGLLIAGDVGQDRIEEIDIIKKGLNYGWNIMEGTLAYAVGNETGLELPIWEYEHDQGNCTIGGFVYHGSDLTKLRGSYIYGDYVTGRIWALSNYDTPNPLNRELLKTDLQITSFGVDEKNEVYICTQEGTIYRVTQSEVVNL